MSSVAALRVGLTGLFLCLASVFSSGSARAQAPNTTDPAAAKATSSDAAPERSRDDKCSPPCDDCLPQGGLRVTRLFPIDIGDASNTGSASLELRNTFNHPFRGLLCAGDFVSALTGRPLAAQVTFGDTKTGERKGCYALDLPCGARLTLPVSVQGTWQAGEAAAPLLIEGKPVLVEDPAGGAKPAYLATRKTQLPFNVKVLEPGLVTSPIAVVSGTPLSLVVQNDDTLTYSARWRFFVNGAQVAPLDAKGLPVASATLQLSPGSNALVIALPDRLFPSRLLGILRPTTLEGRLAVDYVDKTNGPTTAPPRALAVFLSLSRSSPAAAKLWGSLICFALLAIGGVASLVLNHGIPNAFQRLAVRRQLDPLANVVKRLSPNIDDTLRVELRVQRAQLSWRITNEPVVFPAASEFYDEVAKDTEVLSRRILLVAAIDQRLQRTERMGGSGPPQLLDAEKKRLFAALRLLESRSPTAAEFSSIDTLIDEVDAQLARIEGEDPKLREQLVAGATAVWSHFVQAWQELPPDGKWADMLRTKMGPFYAHAKRCFEDAGNGAVADESLATIDTAVAKLQLILQYIRVCASATPEKQARFDETSAIDNARSPTTAPTQRERFFEGLAGTGARTLEEARVLLREAEQGIFVLHLVQQIKLRKCTVRAQPHSIGTYDPVQFGFVFYEDKFNDAVARDKLDCLWKFEGSEGTRTEDCWNPAQFFAKSGEKKVSVQILNGPDNCMQDSGNDETTAFNLKLEVTEARDHAMRQRVALEGLQLTIALAVTLGALLSGAHDQLQKLDPLTAMAAIVALGFGADTVKNLVSRRPASAAPPARTA
jgi:hypothetical protein